MISNRDFAELRLSVNIEWHPLLDAIQYECNDRTPNLYDILNCIRDMPYRRPNHRLDTYSCLREWSGTCSDKHQLIHRLLSELGLHPSYWMATTKVDSSIPWLSEQMQKELGVEYFYDVHNYISCDLGDGEITIDLTFPSYMKPFEFYVCPTLSAGVQGKVCCAIVEKYRVEDLSEASSSKVELLKHLNSPRHMELRERLICDLGHYITHAGDYENMESSVVMTISSKGIPFLYGK